VFLPKPQEPPAHVALGRRSALLRGLATPPAGTHLAPPAPPDEPQDAQRVVAPMARPDRLSTPNIGGNVSAPRRAERGNTDRGTDSTSIAVACRVVALVDDTSAAVLLSQLIYWSRRGRDMAARSGWVYKTAREWEVETGLTWKMQRRARRLLLDLGLIEERLQSMPARLEFRLNLSVLLPALSERSEVELPVIDWSWIADRDDPALGRLLGRSFLFNAALTSHMSVPAAMMASRLLSAQPKRSTSGGRAREAAPKLVQLSRLEWREETGLTRHQWQTARRDLRRLGLLIERRHNFPRRVDLAVDAAAISELLAIKATVPASARAAAGSVWAKQAGRFGYQPNQPTESPKPAHSDRPNRPIAIAQTGLYLSEELQGQLHPQPNPRASAFQIPWSMPEWGWGGQQKCRENEPGPTKSRDEAYSPPAEGSEESLVWPSLFEDEDRSAARSHLAGLDRAIQQLVLDEIDWQHARQPVRSPVGLLRTLCRKARAGEFAADGAHRISSARRKRQHALEASRQAQTPLPATDFSVGAPDAAKERLRNLATELRKRVRSA
jgi:hypothetical protein